MTTRARPTNVTSAPWALVLACIALVVLAFGLLEARAGRGVPRPEISSVDAPDDPTDVRAATFMFTDERSVTFECSLDGAAFAACGHGVFGSVTYRGPLALGRHVFAVRATSGTRSSGLDVYDWTIVTAGGPSPSGGATANPLPFHISGDVSGLVPGIATIVALTLENPNAEPIEVTSVTATIAAQGNPPGCPSTRYISLDQPTGITGRDPVLVPAHGSVVLSAFPRALRITLLPSAAGVDACKGTSFALSYSGSARS